MLSEPQIVERPARPYVGIKATVTPPFGPVLDKLFPEIFDWVAAHGLTPAGPPLIRYHTTDMQNGMEIEVGLPVAEPVTGDERARPGTLPAGPYLVATHTGPYDDLMDATATCWPGPTSTTSSSRATATGGSDGSSSTRPTRTRRPISRSGSPSSSS